MNTMRPIPDMITDLRALANSPEALISHAALLDDAANYIEGATGSLRQHMQMLTEMRVRLEQVRPIMEEAAKQLEEYAEANNMPDIENIAQSLSGEAAQTLYRLTLS